MQPIFEIIKQLDRMESELTVFKQTVVASMEHKLRDLRTHIVGKVDGMMLEKTYSTSTVLFKK